MKKITSFLSFVLMTVLLYSCGPNVPDNINHGLSVKENGFKPGLSPNDPVQVIYDSTVLVKPTWGQSNHFASERGDFMIWQVIGAILLISVIVLIYGYATESKWVPKVSPTFLFAFIFVLSVGSLTSFKWQSSSIMWNNDKWIPKSQFDKSIKETGSTKLIWDSLENECKIVFGPYDCFKK